MIKHIRFLRLPKKYRNSYGQNQKAYLNSFYFITIYNFSSVNSINVGQSAVLTMQNIQKYKTKITLNNVKF